MRPTDRLADQAGETPTERPIRDAPTATSRPHAIKASYRARHPFEVGDLVAHRAETGTRGVVTSLMFAPTTTEVQVSWGPGQDEIVSHLVLERHYDSEDADDRGPSHSDLSTFPWGTQVLHLTEPGFGIVTGHRVAEWGLQVRVQWDSEQYGWHQLCELTAYVPPPASPPARAV